MIPRAHAQPHDPWHRTAPATRKSSVATKKASGFSVHKIAPPQLPPTTATFRYSVYSYGGGGGKRQEHRLKKRHLLSDAGIHPRVRFILRRSLRRWARRERRADPRGPRRYPGGSSGPHLAGEERDRGGSTGAVAGARCSCCCPGDSLVQRGQQC